jgi:uncharacterized CHY-type Zn-finger protein
VKSSEKSPGRSRPAVQGIGVDAATRCAHYSSPLDIVAIKLPCCGEFYACKDCHDAVADHPLVAWPRSARHTSAILCGACGSQLTIDEYLACGSVCPDCGAGFNPRCSYHHQFYFSES